MNKDTKITILNQYFYPENITSASLPYELAQELVKSYDVNVVAGIPQEYNNDKVINTKEVKDGIKIERIKYIYIETGSLLSVVLLTIFHFSSQF